MRVQAGSHRAQGLSAQSGTNRGTTPLTGSTASTLAELGITKHTGKLDPFPGGTGPNPLTTYKISCILSEMAKPGPVPKDRSTDSTAD